MPLNYLSELKESCTIAKSRLLTATRATKITEWKSAFRPGVHDTGLLVASDWLRQNRAVFIAVTRHRIAMKPLLIVVTRH